MKHVEAQITKFYYLEKRTKQEELERKLERLGEFVNQPEKITSSSVIVTDLICLSCIVVIRYNL